MLGLKNVGAALLVLGLYHLFWLQYHTATTEAPTPACRRLFRAGSHRQQQQQQQQQPQSQRDDTSAADDGAQGGRAGEARPATPAWKLPEESNLVVNAPGTALLAATEPRTTTLHFTFGSLSMLDFLHNWRHHVERVGLSPALVGAADAQMLKACSREGIAALGIAQGLDVWQYTRSAHASTVVQEGKSEWAYYRHHNSSFLELGLVKAAFLWELLTLGYDVLISDLDVVWLSDGCVARAGRPTALRHLLSPAPSPTGYAMTARFS